MVNLRKGINMIVNKVFVESFRGFKNQSFNLGKQITLIAGQNGTQKSTLLGILTQTFTIPSEHQFHAEKPLSGGTYKSAFSDKFKLSPDLDKPGEHLWSLYFYDKELHPDLDEDGRFTIESIPRSTEQGEVVRFWQKGKRDKGSGYVNIPVIFLSLKRLVPIAESGVLKPKDINLIPSEKEWFEANYNKILISQDQISNLDYLSSSQKTLFGVTSNYYDWHSNSAGQDNLSKILLAVLSFKSLKEKYPNEYQGGILAIDEIDAALYPASQVKLLASLCKYASKFQIQILTTTHSLYLLEEAAKIQSSVGRGQDIKTLFLKKADGKIEITENKDIESIKNNLNVALGAIKKRQKVKVFTEDKEAEDFLKAILKQKYSGKLEFIPTPLGCGNLIDLAKRKLKPFNFPYSIVVLDGDAQSKLNSNPKIIKNFICLPGGNKSPEQLLADYLNRLSDTHAFWGKHRDGYSRQYCFNNYSYEDINANREKAKNWYNEQMNEGVWGQRGRSLYNLLLKELEEEVELFLSKFEQLFKQTKIID